MVSKSEFVRAKLLGRIGKTIMMLGGMIIFFAVSPLLTGRFPTGPLRLETIMTLLWLVPILFAVDMSAAALWYSHEYDKQSKPLLKRCSRCNTEFFQKKRFERCPNCGGKAHKVKN